MKGFQVFCRRNASQNRTRQPVCHAVAWYALPIRRIASKLVAVATLNLRRSNNAKSAFRESFQFLENTKRQTCQVKIQRERGWYQFSRWKERPTAFILWKEENCSISSIGDGRSVLLHRNDFGAISPQLVIAPKWTWAKGVAKPHGSIS